VLLERYNAEYPQTPKSCGIFVTLQAGGGYILNFMYGWERVKELQPFASKLRRSISLLWMVRMSVCIGWSGHGEPQDVEYY